MNAPDLGIQSLLLVNNIALYVGGITFLSHRVRHVPGPERARRGRIIRLTAGRPERRGARLGEIPRNPMHTDAKRCICSCVSAASVQTPCGGPSGTDPGKSAPFSHHLCTSA